MGEDCIRVDGESIDLASDACKVDAAQLQRSADAADWERVIDLYEGPFLDQLALPGAPEFEIWRSAARSRLADLAQRAFAARIDRLLTAGERESALATAWSWTRLAPFDPEAHRILIILLARSGDRSAAIERYESYRAALAQSARTEPSADLSVGKLF